MLIAKLGLTSFHPDPRLRLPGVSRQPQGGEGEAREGGHHQKHVRRGRPGQRPRSDPGLLQQHPSPVLQVWWRRQGSPPRQTS